MSKRQERFECLMEPGNTWMVWDSMKAQPAQYMQNRQAGLSREKALLMCRLLNSIAADDRFRSLAS